MASLSALQCGCVWPPALAPYAEAETFCATTHLRLAEQKRRALCWEPSRKIINSFVILTASVRFRMKVPARLVLAIPHSLHCMQVIRCFFIICPKHRPRLSLASPSPAFRMRA